MFLTRTRETPMRPRDSECREPCLCGSPSDCPGLPPEPCRPASFTTAALVVGGSLLACGCIVFACAALQYLAGR